MPTDQQREAAMKAAEEIQDFAGHCYGRHPTGEEIRDIIIRECFPEPAAPKNEWNVQVPDPAIVQEDGK